MKKYFYIVILLFSFVFGFTQKALSIFSVEQGSNEQANSVYGFNVENKFNSIVQGSNHNDATAYFTILAEAFNLSEYLDADIDAELLPIVKCLLPSFNYFSQQIQGVLTTTSKAFNHSPAAHSFLPQKKYIVLEVFRL